MRDTGQAFHLRIESNGEQVRILAGAASGRLAHGSLPAERLRAARIDPPALLLPGDDRPIAEFEAQVGRALAEVWTAGPVAMELGAALARGRGEPFLLVVDAPDPALAELPWELLADADGHGLEATGRAVVARRATGGGQVVADGAAWDWVWCPDPADPVAAGLLDALGLPTSPPPEGALVTFVVAHGTRAHGALALSGPGSELAGSGVVHSLSPALTRSALVVLAVCDAGAAEAQRVLAAVSAAGAGAVVAPRGRLGPETAACFVGALRRGLAEGVPVGRAVAVARRAVAARGSPFPEDRWARLALYLGDDRSAEARFGGWIGAARAVARRMGSPFTGYEHLVLALVEGPPVSELAQLRYALAARVEAIRDRLSLYVGDPCDARLTPRLRAAGADPWATFADSAAATELAGAGWSRPPGDHTLPAWTDDGPTGGPANGLEVVLGPEDGRVLRMLPGQVLGRASGGRPDVPLYADGATDPRLSRTHLRWLGEGQLELLSPARIGGRQVGGRITFRIGARLALSRATVVVGVP